MLSRFLGGFFQPPEMSISEVINNGDDTKAPQQITVEVQKAKMADIESGKSPAAFDKEAPESAEQSSEIEVKAPQKKLCGVCNENDGKYKCSRCYLPYCSVTCSKQHKINHPPDEPKPEHESNPIKPETSDHGRAGTIAGKAFKGLFAALDDSEELRLLFKLYPNLPMVLDQIHTATLPPLDEYTVSGLPTKARKGNEQPWSSDRGLQKGVEALKQARNSDGKDGEGLREYGRLVLQILAGEEGMTTEQIIQKELAEENARIIEQLLNGDIG
ncbi:uncharacterized protein PAC_03091 [Phialocephala subalpina]|uniref:HIT-type domain-containing protein n=1 Tax=Phialocephala subalpina TaxID=576137 RepID=A0A1L7WKE4_9HELO|nr:uncharacterized protein PAC_03091 [Phialocephala subalpina]